MYKHFKGNNSVHILIEEFFINILYFYQVV